MYVILNAALFLNGAIDRTMLEWETVILERESMFNTHLEYFGREDGQRCHACTREDGRAIADYLDAIENGIDEARERTALGDLLDEIFCLA